MIAGQISLAALSPASATRTFSLVSGSSGNSVFVGQRSTKILVDCGVSAKRLTAALNGRGEDPADITGILITHEHSDHIAGLSVLARRHNIPVYMPEATWLQLRDKMRFSERLDVRFIEPGQHFEVGESSVYAFATSHDAACPVGYRIDTGRSIVGVATDTGELSTHHTRILSGCDLVYIEANYDLDMLYGGPYPWSLKKRIDSIRGHLSNRQTAAAIGDLVRGGGTRFVLAHLSKENNLPELALRSITSDLDEEGFRTGLDLRLQVAPRFEPSPVFEL